MKYLLLILALLACEQKETTKIIDHEVQVEVPIEVPPPVSPAPNFVSFPAFESQLLADLTSGISTAEQENAAFFNLCDQLNAGRISDEMRRGVEKGINSLSREVTLEPGTWIGETKCVLRVDLRDYGLNNSLWAVLEDADPLKLESFTDRGLLIKQLTGKRRPWMHGTVFLEFAMTNNTYYELLDIPANLTDFLTNFAGCDLQRDFDDEDEQVFFAGIRRSLIALQKNRSIYIHDCQDGPFAGTYDVIRENITSAGRNLSVNPFPIEARTNNTFAHDAQEFIGTLPNGLQFYALFNNQGIREICAPTNIVVDNVRPEVAPDICNARSCVSCHSGGYIEGNDFVSSHVTGNPNFDQREIEIGQFFYGRPEGMRAAIRQANALYADSLAKLRITNTSTDPINVLTDRIRREMDVKLVAGMFHLTDTQFIQLLPQSPIGLLAVGQLLNGGTINFQDLIQVKDILIDDLNLFQERVGE